MSRIPMTQAVAADYADAMLVCRRAKHLLFLLLAMVLLIQLAVFFVVRYVPAVKIRPAAEASITLTPGGGNEFNASAVKSGFAQPAFWQQTIQYVVSDTNYLGVVLPLVLSAILLLILGIMLVGRLVGVTQVTGAFCWSIVFIVLMFPWQSLFNTATYSPPGVDMNSASEIRDVRIPGVLYTYPELVQYYDFDSSNWRGNLPSVILHWARFVGFPVIALLILLMVQGRSGRGLRLALGEAEVPIHLHSGSV